MSEGGSLGFNRRVPDEIPDYVFKRRPPKRPVFRTAEVAILMDIIAQVRNLHDNEDGVCPMCHVLYPCPTIEIVGEPSE